MLADSGCIDHCPFQTFHDNLVAHDGAGQVGEAPCRTVLSRAEIQWKLLTQNWIRPEDLHHYDSLFDTVKVATRAHDNPRKVVAAYARERYRGNLLDLLEPGNSPLIPGNILDNGAFPDDWFEQTTQCDRDCVDCLYCRRTFRQVLVKISERPGIPVDLLR